jgi:hypothetical protein
MPKKKTPQANPTCILCGYPCETAHGNNPSPLATEGVCCNKCNDSVIEARLKGLVLGDFNGENNPSPVVNQHDPDSWEGKANRILVGRRIVSVEWLSEEETRQLGWSQRPIIIQLDDGTIIYPMADDEGNGAGALGTTNPIAQTLPVF